MKKIVFVIAVMLVLIISCSPTRMQADTHKLIKLQGYTQGTTFAISYIALDSLLTMQQAMALFAELDQSLSIYKKESLISRFNNSEQGLKIDKHLKAVIQKAFETSRKSNGLFDVTIYPLVKAWGFADQERKENIPDSITIVQLITCVGYQLLALKDDFLYKKKACVKMDVNGIAQGYSVDYIASKLAARGVKNYMVEVGGEIAVKGSNIIQKRHWTIAIEQPHEDDTCEPYRAYVQLKNMALTTSGNYHKFYISNGKYISHLIDPRTGYSFNNNMISATVMARNAIVADAYDNVLMALGMEKAIEFVKKHKGLEAYVIYKKANGEVADTMTAGFKKLLIRYQE